MATDEGQRLRGQRPWTDGEPSDVEVYLGIVAEEQARFLSALSAASTALTAGQSSGRLTEAVAHQHRLTQQFLDAQRSIVRRRAEGEEAIRRVSTVGADDTVTPRSVAGDDLVARDRAVQRRHLRALLNRWWQEENDWCGAELEDAETRLALHTHWEGDAELLSSEIVPGAAPDRLLDAGRSALPDDVRRALECVDAADLTATLDALLGERAADEHDGSLGQEETLADELALLLGVDTSDRGDADEPVEPPPDPVDEAFDTFWTSLVQRPERHRRRRVLPVAMSGASVAGAATILLALVGR